MFGDSDQTLRQGQIDDMQDQPIKRLNNQLHKLTTMLTGLCKRKQLLVIDDKHMYDKRSLDIRSINFSGVLLSIYIPITAMATSTKILIPGLPNEIGILVLRELEFFHLISAFFVNGQ